ncbi:MAG TPA: hypothetical protein VMW42_12890 [Desulfatiglandales bacterium]|nr:hypothetical protein [Desulfatiglandales bacterium]
MSIIEFDRKIGRQIKINKRAEFTFPNQYREEIENSNDFPQQYKVIIGKEKFSGGLYLNPRPYYYFEIHKNGHNSFFNLVKNKKTFHVKVDLLNKIVNIE